MTDFDALFRSLEGADVRYIVIGGMAGVFHGAARVTYDIDVVYERSEENFARIVEALQPHSPYLRGAPPGLPFTFDVKTLQRGFNFTLTTTLGDIDLLAEAAGNGTYESLAENAIEVDFNGISIRCVALEDLIHLKRAAGRPKDLEAIAELEAIADQD